MRLSVFLLVVAAVLATVCASPPVKPDTCDPIPDGCVEGLTSSPLKVLTFNSFLLPLIAPRRADRGAAIAEMLCPSAPEYDVIAFQEVFEFDTLFDLCDSYGYQVEGYGDEGFIEVLGSGLVVFSKHKVIRSDTIKYRDRAGSEVLANKGALLVEIEVKVPGTTPTPINVFVTHAQSNLLCSETDTKCQEKSGEVLDDVWDGQFRQLKAWMDKVATKGAPRFLVGDLNIDGFNKPNNHPIDDGKFIYTSMMALLEPDFTDLWVGTGNPFDASYGVTYPDSGSRLDYILADGFPDALGEGNLFWNTTTSTNTTVNKMEYFGPIDLPQGDPLSDHYGVEIDIAVNSVCCIHRPEKTFWEILLQFLERNVVVLTMTAVWIISLILVAVYVPARSA